MNKNNGIKIVSLLLLIVAVCGICFIGLKQKYLEQTENRYQALRSRTEKSEKEETHNFVQLQKENEDIYGWIYVPGTQVDYPVLQSEQDNFYLSHDVTRAESVAGAIYSNQCNSIEMTDYITVLYGHDMKAGTMFASLHCYDEETFLQENPIFYFETEEKKSTYEILGVYNYNDRYIPAVFDVKSASGMLSFWDSLEKCAEEKDALTHAKPEASITEEDRLLVLSTCIRDQDERRFLVVGKQIQQ